MMVIPIRARGPGKYDDACTLAREATKADATVLIVINGSKGHGFSVQTHSEKIMFELPTLLRILAKDIEDELTKEGDDGHDGPSGEDQVQHRVGAAARRS